MPESYDFAVRRDDLHETGFLEAPSDLEISLESRQALLRIESFSLTANNITYAAMGDAMGYWKFFPADDGWGRVPAWGFAEVLRSGVDGLETGDRIYGYLPMSEFLVVEPTGVGPSGFVDATAHRKELPAAYNRYSRASKARDKRARDAQVAIFAPLFATSFMLDDWLSTQAAFGAERLLISSASSKTALALAWLVGQDSRMETDLIGLTSSRNSDFVESTGYYDCVIPYEDLVETEPDTGVVYLDFSGDSKLKWRVHDHFRGKLEASVTIGATSWDKLAPGPDAPDLVGPAPELFFAPTHIARRTEDWGAAELWKKIGTQQDEFIESSDDWLEVRHGEGKEAIRSAYLEVLAGGLSPATGWSLAP